METSPLPNIVPFLHDLADAAAVETLARFRTGGTIDNKQADGFDPVTDADRMAEKVIRLHIEQHFPDHRVLGEEFGETGGPSAFRWIVDPVDGTRAFICGVPCWTTLVGLEQDGVPIAGLISQPFIGERWIGGSGIPTQIYGREGGQACAVSSCTTLDQARLMVTDLRPGEYFREDEAHAVLALSRSCLLTRLGLDSYGFALIASGNMDLCIEAGLSWYDIAAVVPVIEAAGGVVVTWTGEPAREGFHRGRVIVAATQQLADEAVARLRPVSV